MFAVAEEKPTTDSHIRVVASQDGLGIAFDLLVDVFQDTDFDNLIGRVIFPLTDEEVADRRQYREGYISYRKRDLLDFPSDFFVAVLREQDPKLGYCKYAELQGHKYRRKSTQYYNAGSGRAATNLRDRA